MEGEFLKILQNVFFELNAWIGDHNAKAFQEGFMPLKKQTLKIVGQMALLLADLPFSVTSTMDLDLIANPDYPVSKTLQELLLEKGIVLESDAHLIWMPPSTHYSSIYEGIHLEALLADPGSVILSKCKFNRLKDRFVIKSYLEHFPDFRKNIENAGISWKG